MYGIARGAGISNHLKMSQNNGPDNPNPPARSAIRPGVQVWVIEKENYGTTNYKQGFVQDILTSIANHPRGVKVRLTDGTIGRVQWLVED
jgi:uncharacterized repeat protein (TIGR03833 family)